FDHYDALLPEEQSEIEEFEEQYFEIKVKHLSAVDALNGSSIVNSSAITPENCIMNELSPRETKLMKSPCNTVQGQNISFLPTAKGHDCAVLLDSGSDATYISESLINKLRIKRTNACINIKGLGCSESAVTCCSACLNIAPKYGSDKKYLQIDAFILNKLMSNLTTKQMDEKDLNYLYSTKFADLKFSIPKKIDLANYFFSCLLPGQIIKSVNDRIAQNTIFGCVVSNKMKITGNATHKFNSFQISLSCNDSIVYPHASNPDNSNGKTFDLHSTYKDGSQISRPAKRRHRNRGLDSSKNENIRVAEPSPIPSPKRALWYQNPKVTGQSSSHETTDMPTQQNFRGRTSATGCLLSSSGAGASRCNTSIGDAPFRLCSRFTKFGIE
ncbi:hypothetical protein NPIL_458061, partial [Nephila pilipes]